MKKSYEVPVMEVLKFDAEDVITTSSKLIDGETWIDTNEANKGFDSWGLH